jgi:hypothetical protein
MTGHQLTVAGYLLAGGALLALELAGRVPRSPVPRLGALATGLSGSRSGRVGLWLLWWWLAWHFVAR